MVRRLFNCLSKAEWKTIVTTLISMDSDKMCTEIFFKDGNG